MSYKILAINPGSTSTKIAVFEDDRELFVKSIEHEKSELVRFKDITDQFDFRSKCVMEAISESGVQLSELSAVVGRGGQLPPVKAGGYLVNEDMIKELRGTRVVSHASNLGALVAYSIAKPLGIPAYIYDAVASDEMKEIAKITGVPEITRQSFCHVLNSKAMARKVAATLGKSYFELNFIVAHIGGGVSISAHENGRIIDAISDDGGPFSPERSGSVPLGYIVEMCYSGKYGTKKEFMDKLKKFSGLSGHLGTNDAREVEKRISGGDETARLVYDAMCYQISKGIGEMAAVLCGRIDGIILTGGIARSKYVVSEITRQIGFLGEVFVLPGENEMESLAAGALRLLRGEETAWEYVYE